MENIKELKKKLPRGSQTVISKKLNLHVSAVNHALNGRQVNDDVIFEAIQIAKQAEKKRKAIKDGLNELMNM